jgi:hypothetical protein
VIAIRKDRKITRKRNKTLNFLGVDVPQMGLFGGAGDNEGISSITLSLIILLVKLNFFWITRNNFIFFGTYENLINPF